MNLSSSLPFDAHEMSLVSESDSWKNFTNRWMAREDVFFLLSKPEIVRTKVATRRWKEIPPSTNRRHLLCLPQMPIARHSSQGTSAEANSNEYSQHVNEVTNKKKSTIHDLPCLIYT